MNESDLAKLSKTDLIKLILSLKADQPRHTNRGNQSLHPVEVSVKWFKIMRKISYPTA